MNDETKIRALMVYSRHWGSEQARVHRAIDGIRQTNAIIQREFDGLRYCDTRQTSFWQLLASSLLEGMNHYAPYDENDFKHLYARARFASEIGASFFSPHVSASSEEQRRRISAIVALQPILLA